MGADGSQRQSFKNVCSMMPFNQYSAWIFDFKNFPDDAKISFCKIAEPSIRSL